MVLKADQQRVKALLTETITLLCKNGLHFNSELCIDALVGITLDQEDVFLVSIKETIRPQMKPSDKKNNIESSDTRSDTALGSRKRRRKRPGESSDDEHTPEKFHVGALPATGGDNSLIDLDLKSERFSRDELALNSTGTGRNVLALTGSAWETSESANDRLQVAIASPRGTEQDQQSPQKRTRSGGRTVWDPVSSGVKEQSSYETSSSYVLEEIAGAEDRNSGYGTAGATSGGAKGDSSDVISIKEESLSEDELGDQQLDYSQIDYLAMYGGDGATSFAGGAQNYGETSGESAHSRLSTSRRSHGGARPRAEQVGII